MDWEVDALFAYLESNSAEDASPTPAAGEYESTIGETARLFGLTERALRFYEAKGLLAPRRNGAVRFYGQLDRDRLAAILKAKHLGFTLTEIRQMLAAPEPGEGSALNISRRQCFEQIKLLEQRKREIENALAELRRTYSSFYARLVSAERNLA